MHEIKELNDIRGNNVVTYSIQTLLDRGSFPNFSIMSGVMGVGKTSVAKVVANKLNQSDSDVRIYNFGMDVDMQALRDEVFSLNPAKPRAFIFEELHGLPRNDQNALLQMIDSQSRNVYVICTTTELTKVIRPLRSRAQTWEFKLLSDKQLSALLDDYLIKQNVTLPANCKKALLRSCKGVPRDLLKSADFAIAGDFSAAQLDDLLGNVSDELMFSVFCSLHADTVSFVANLEELLDEGTETKLSALQDFWLRYIMERSGAVRKTLTPTMVSTLDQLYPKGEAAKIAKMLLRAQPDTLMLELVTMNMALTGATTNATVGQQRETARTAESAQRLVRQQTQQIPKGAAITSMSIDNFKLGGNKNED